MMENAIDVTALDYKYPLGNEILKEANYHLPKGGFHVILGKNGTGKSTFLHLLMGYRMPTGGEIKLLGLDPIKDQVELKQKIAYISHSIELPKKISVRDFLDMNATFYPSYNKDKERELLKVFEIDESKSLFQLSTGQNRRVLLIAAFSRQSELIIIDEMTAVLDPLAREELITLLDRERKDSGCSIILATNIPDDITSHIDSVWHIRQNKLFQTLGISESLIKEGY